MFASSCNARIAAGSDVARVSVDCRGAHVDALGHASCGIMGMKDEAGLGLVLPLESGRND